MAPAPGQPVHSHMLRELSETGHAIVRSRTVTVFCRYHDNYISGVVVTGADQSGTEVGYKIVLPRSPWYLWLKTTLTLGLRPRVRVVYNHKSLATVVELLNIGVEKKTSGAHRNAYEPNTQQTQSFSVPLE